MLKKMFCQECGSEIVVTYDVPQRNFEIIDGKVKETTNHFNSPGIIFHCSNDMEHEVGSLGSKWVDTVEKGIKKLI